MFGIETIPRLQRLMPVILTQSQAFGLGYYISRPWRFNPHHPALDNQSFFT